jgi:hypothetical protein
LQQRRGSTSFRKEEERRRRTKKTAGEKTCVHISQINIGFDKGKQFTIHRSDITFLLFEAIHLKNSTT